MQRQEVRSLADAAGEGTRVLTSLVRDLHSGIASRVFGMVGPAGKPVELIHNATAAATYHAVDRALRASLRGAGLEKLRRLADVVRAIAGQQAIGVVLRRQQRTRRSLRHRHRTDLLTLRQRPPPWRARYSHYGYRRP